VLDYIVSLTDSITASRTCGKQMILVGILTKMAMPFQSAALMRIDFLLMRMVVVARNRTVSFA